ncbi:prepilin peptidase [Lachnospiraceae bacterium ZAX-1]
MVQTGTLFSLLVICSIEDIKKKKITCMYLLLFGIVGILLHLIYQNCTTYSLMGGLMIGLVLMALSKLTKGSIGIGDGLLLAITGIYLGVEDNMELLMTGLLFAAVWSLWLLTVCKKKRKHEIAFIPCLLIAYITMIVR